MIQHYSFVNHISYLWHAQLLDFHIRSQFVKSDAAIDDVTFCYNVTSLSQNNFPTIKYHNLARFTPNAMINKTKWYNRFHINLNRCYLQIYALLYIA